MARTAPGVYARSSAADGRRWRLFVPSTHNGALLVMLHGCAQDADDCARGTRLDAHAERLGLAVAFPEQPLAANDKKCWNWFDPAHQRRDAGEAGSVAAVAAEAAAEVDADPRRIYLGGISAGAGMAAIVATAYPERFAGLALHSGVPLGAAADLLTAMAVMMGQPTAIDGDPATPLLSAMGERARAIPVIVFQGGTDPLVHPSNVHRVLTQWAQVTERLGVAPSGTLERNGREEKGQAGGFHYTRTVYGPTAQRPLLEKWFVEELGHDWSGGAPEGSFSDPRGPDATTEILRFLLSHRLSS